MKYYPTTEAVWNIRSVKTNWKAVIKRNLISFWTQVHNHWIDSRNDATFLFCKRSFTMLRLLFYFFQIESFRACTPSNFLLMEFHYAEITPNTLSLVFNLHLIFLLCLPDLVPEFSLTHTWFLLEKFSDFFSDRWIQSDG